MPRVEANIQTYNPEMAVEIATKIINSRKTPAARIATYMKRAFRNFFQEPMAGPSEITLVPTPFGVFIVKRPLL